MNFEPRKPNSPARSRKLPPKPIVMPRIIADYSAGMARRGELEVAVVPDQGHAPLLAEPKLIRQIAAFVASCDVSARR